MSIGLEPLTARFAQRRTLGICEVHVIGVQVIATNFFEEFLT
jgi:hypothetical protein